MVHYSSSVIKHCLSRIFQPTTLVSKTAVLKKNDITSKSQKLLLDLGIIHQANPGSFHFLPLGVRALNKLINLVDSEMEKIGGQKIEFSALINSKLWETSGRLNNSANPELFQLTDRHNHQYILSPTHEESAADLIASLPLQSYKQFPLKLYQISNKFRDEMKPRFGLMRGRQFLMKDMYSFNVDVESAQETYQTICGSYDNFFQKLGVDFVKVLGTSGNMGGNLSHEYHFKASIGEDKVLLCNSCNYVANVELCGEEKCPKCNETNVKISNGIEVGHTFFLGDTYSSKLNANYLSKSGKPITLQMGSYGLGLTRILAASVEVLSLEQEIRWPDLIAPYNVVIIPPKLGSKEELLTQGQAEELYVNIDSLEAFQDNVVLDDRTNLTIGRRFLDARRIGYRYIIVLGQKSTEAIPMYELNDLKKNLQIFLSKSDLFEYFKGNETNERLNVLA